MEEVAASRHHGLRVVFEVAVPSEILRDDPGSYRVRTTRPRDGLSATGGGER
jgi:hypothetical protein